jgi:hypothetical protein
MRGFPFADDSHRSRKWLALSDDRFDLNDAHFRPEVVFFMPAPSFFPISLRKRRPLIRGWETLCPIGSLRSQPAARVRQGPI